MDAQLIQTLTVYALPVLFGLAWHEAAHAYAAMALGDRTAYQLGRTTLNPIAHIDPVGTVAVPLFIVLTNALTGADAPLIGWAKSTPYLSRNFRNPKRDEMLVAAAGPMANVAMMVMWIMLFNANSHLGLNEAFVRHMAVAGINTNIGLAALNLLPILPLDGGKILAGLLPVRAAMTYSRLEPYGMIVLLVLMVTQLLMPLMMPMMMLLSGLAEMLVF